MINIDIELTGLARKLCEMDNNQVIREGLEQAATQACVELGKNFIKHASDVKWPLTKDGREALLVTGQLMIASSVNASISIGEDNFEIQAASGNRSLVAIVQDERYNFFALSDDALKDVGDVFLEGALT